MINLAGNKDCDKQIHLELTRCGIDIHSIPLGHSEVPYTLEGRLVFQGLTGFVFHRAWYYWMVTGDVPLPVAELLYKDPVGVKDIRVAGHCGCPSPSRVPYTYGVSWMHPSGKEGIARKNQADFKRSIASGLLEVSVLDKYIFTDDPVSEGCLPVVRSYHIDSELGLYIFANSLKTFFGTKSPVIS
jgi:hypothetical protein